MKRKCNRNNNNIKQRTMKQERKEALDKIFRKP